AGAAALADRRSGQKSLFGAMDEDADDATDAVPLPNVPEIEQREKLLLEKEVLGFYLSAHPLEEYEAKLAAFCSHSTQRLSDMPDRGQVVVGGMISAIKLAHTKNGRPGAPTKYANFDLEDRQGVVRCILWPDGFEQTGHHVQPDSVVVVNGTVDRRGGGDEANLIINEIIPIDQMEQRYTRGVIIRVDEGEHPQDTLRKVHEIVRGYPGKCELQLALKLNDGSQVVLRSHKVKIDVTSQLKSRVDDLLGPGHLTLITERPEPRSAGGNGNRSQNRRS
ncbi:MAG: OB-fold nucleic acid binding domain-containing protein, partial [Pirellulaceae bacterium]|nr:OB-fold nucleic acid binding domain-containing protein [Pirellulaceae bacterium]